MILPFGGANRTMYAICGARLATWYAICGSIMLCEVLYRKSDVLDYMLGGFSRHALLYPLLGVWLYTFLNAVWRIRDAILYAISGSRYTILGPHGGSEMRSDMLYRGPDLLYYMLYKCPDMLYYILYRGPDMLYYMLYTGPDMLYYMLYRSPRMLDYMLYMGPRSAIL